MGALLFLVLQAPQPLKLALGIMNYMMTCCHFIADPSQMFMSVSDDIPLIGGGQEVSIWKW